MAPTPSEGIAWGTLPNGEHLASGLQLYLDHKILPGDFLIGMLSNSISKAVAHADGTNRNLIPDIAQWLYNEFPLEAWGSEDKVLAWISE